MNLRCITCHEEKPEDGFYRARRNTKRNGRATECKSCVSIRCRRWRYGLEPEEYTKLYEETGGICPVCGHRPVQVVDHDHETNDVRGLLCQPCNIALGTLGDSLAGAKRLVAYLEAR
jgi:hypothetical protein